MKIKRRLKHALSRPLLKLVYFTIPRLYFYYMTFVWYTSKIEFYGLEKAGVEGRKRDDGSICTLWHENVFFVTYAFREVNGSTIASISDFGELISQMLKMCKFEIFRGGSSKGKKSRHKTGTLSSMIQHMQNNHHIMYGITTDGSNGPRYKNKKGAIIIARETGVPIYTVHITSKPTIRISTWDRTRIALPFSHIVCFFEGPYYFESSDEQSLLKKQQEYLDRAMMDNMHRTEHYLNTGEILSPEIMPNKYYKESTIRCGKRMVRQDEVLYPTPKEIARPATAELLPPNKGQ